MKKFRMFVMLMMLTLLLSGCGQTQEEKIAEVQEADAITTADVVELLEYRDLTVEKQTPSDAWMEQWPEIEIYKIDGEGLLLMQATEGMPLYQRDKLVQELDWAFWGYRYDSTESAALNQLLTDFVPETGFYAYSHAWEAKNIIACYVPYFDMEQPEEGDVQTEEEQLAAIEMIKEITASSNRVKAVFYEDINGMEVKDSRAEGQHFTLNPQISYFQVPFEVDGKTTYDLFYEVQARVTLHEDAAEQWRGQDAKVEIQHEKAGIGATKRAGTSGTFEELFEGDREYAAVIDDRFIVGPQPQEMLEFQVIVTVGDYVETFDVTLDLLNDTMTVLPGKMEIE